MLSTVLTLAYKVSSDMGALLVDKHSPPFHAIIVRTFKDHIMKMDSIATATITKHIRLLKIKPNRSMPKYLLGGITLRSWPDMYI